MVVTDLDGTLLQSQRRPSARNLETLRRLGRRGVLRVIATGRSLFSARKVLPPDFPVDYLLFSSGAGIMDWPAQRLLRAGSMGPQQGRRAFRALEGRGRDFMVHEPIPENHCFRWYSAGGENPDFQARKALYAPFASAGRPGEEPPGEACQLLAVEPAQREPSAYEELAAELADLTGLRTTSPLDGRSRWLEVFSPLVSKSQAAAWLARERGVDPRRVLAVGNDYNDLDLLRWAPTRFLASSAPPQLAALFPVARSGDDSDFAVAVEAWERGPGAGPV